MKNDKFLPWLTEGDALILCAAMTCAGIILGVATWSM